MKVTGWSHVLELSQYNMGKVLSCSWQDPVENGQQFRFLDEPLTHCIIGTPRKNNITSVNADVHEVLSTHINNNLKHSDYQKETCSH